jgi:hypothetical protein
MVEMWEKLGRWVSLHLDSLDLLHGSAAVAAVQPIPQIVCFFVCKGYVFEQWAVGAGRVMLKSETMAGDVKIRVCCPGLS